MKTVTYLVVRREAFASLPADLSRSSHGLAQLESYALGAVLTVKEVRTVVFLQVLALELAELELVVAVVVGGHFAVLLALPAEVLVLVLTGLAFG